jgi:hypothetical protein
VGERRGHVGKQTTVLVLGSRRIGHLCDNPKGKNGNAWDGVGVVPGGRLTGRRRTHVIAEKKYEGVFVSTSYFLGVEIK